jgi:uncharacterized protein
MENKFQTGLAELAKKYEVTSIYVFGSQAREAASYVRNPSFSALKPEIDVDIGVQTIPGRRLTLKKRVELALDLEDFFQVFRVDLTVLPEAPPFLALDMIRGELIYCNDLDKQAEDELYVLRRAGDLAHFEKQRRHLIIEGEQP